jgi:uncharacterized membrane protein SpoIIM required for sporulation
MLSMTIITIGFLAVLGMILGFLIYFLKGTLNSDDAKRIDPIDEDNDSK